MTTVCLDIHPASREELVAAHSNVYDIWSKGLGLEEHVRARVDSPSHRRATWYVGTIEGRVVTSLGCYPLRFRVRDDNLMGVAIGSVYTVSDFRGRGFAPQLIAKVEDDEHKRGAALSVLYSDIEPQYYARRGYTLCPSWEGWCQPNAAALEVSDSPQWVPVSATTDLARLAALYADYHGGMPLSIARDDDYWQSLLEKAPNDEFYALVDDGQAWLAYARISVNAGAWRIVDYALADASDSLAEVFYGKVIAAARAAGAARAGGWLPDCPAARRYFELAPRPREITMIKSLSEAVRLDPDLIAATNRFCYIDHV
jgi:predicted N-acetyltransferase YhbS